MQRLALFATAAAFTAALGLAQPAKAADLTIGLTMGVTGPTASIGGFYKRVYDNMPDTLGGQKVKYVFLDDAGDPSKAVQNFRKFAEEEKVDVVLGPSNTPPCLAVAAAANELKVAQVCLSPVEVTDDKRPYVFTVPQSVPVMTSVLAEHMKAKGVKTLAFIGFADGWGDLCWKAMEKQAADSGIQIVAHERYNRTDTSVTSQILKIVAAKPDAVFVGATATPATLPHIALKERGFAGNIYHSHGVIGPDFIRNGGKAVEGAFATSGPLIVANDLPDSNPIKKVALDFFKTFEANYPQVRNGFAGYAYDSLLMVQAALPSALAKAKPGTPEFRAALREGLENIKNLVGTHAIYNMNAGNHNGVDERSRVLVTVKDGAFTLAK
ncbi:MAG: ABC transporter substrate-binding protein [Rhodospirillales bacterium]|nr:ABC transporter substrate-binding protein [Rhodospirillales bacterium]